MNARHAPARAPARLGPRAARLLTALMLLAPCSPRVPAQEPTSRQTGAEALDIAALIREVALAERANNRNFSEYTYTSRVTERESKDGRVTKETVTVAEVYPQYGEAVRKVVSRDGVAVPADEAEREFKRVIRELEKAEREAAKRREQAARQAAGPQAPPAPAPDAIAYFGPQWGFSFRSGFNSGEFVLSLWHFLRACEFHAPRLERLSGRDVIVLSFRPRADFTPARDSQKPYAKLAGVVWIDAADKNIARLEAWPAPGASPKGRAPATSEKDPAVRIEQTRLPDGRWKESLVRLNTTADRELFNNVARDHTEEMTNFQRFTTKAGDAAVAAPPAKPER